MPNKRIYLYAVGLLLLCICTYLFTFTGKNPDYVMPRRSLKIVAMMVVSCATAYSSVVFQTIAANRILTPSIMGFDSFFLLIQSVIVFSYGDRTYQSLSEGQNFALSVVLMLMFALALYVFVFKKEGRNVYFLLLVGLLMGTVFRSISSFIAMLLDPNEFMFFQASMFASFENIDVGLLAISAAMLATAMTWGWRSLSQLDVVAIGKDNAISLGVPYLRVVRQNLLLVAIMVSVSTALVGPITFLGLLTSNLSYELFKNKSHRSVIIGCCLVTSIMVIGGQYLVEHLFNMSTTVSIIINFIGGLYFIYILLKNSRRS